MAPNILPPDPHALLPPLLACLPTAFVAPRPPPSLLSLLSPILKQRLNLLSATPGQPSDASWLRLLCWDPEAAFKLVSAVESTDFEPHPVSGEIELGDIDGPSYRRLDEETLQARLLVPDLNLLVVYVWCEWEDEGGGAGWLVSEVRALSTEESNSTAWSPTMSEANEKSRLSLTNKPGSLHSPREEGPRGTMTGQGADDDDDDYWAQYDKISSRGGSARLQGPSNGAKGEASEKDHYAQYSDVQPAMDNDDPSGQPEVEALGSLNRTALTQGLRNEAERQRAGSMGAGEGRQDGRPENLIHPQPSPRSHSPIAALESSAEAQSHSEVAVQHHISTSMKSLFRLARASGMERAEFSRIVNTELETLSLLEEDD